MKKVTCYIRKNAVSFSGPHPLDLVPSRSYRVLMETYPPYGKIIKRRDFECRSINEAKRIAFAVYGHRAEFHYGFGFEKREQLRFRRGY